MNEWKNALTNDLSSGELYHINSFKMKAVKFALIFKHVIFTVHLSTYQSN